MSLSPQFIDEIASHDARIAETGVAMWVGAEPTFTDRLSFAAEWNAAADGDDKHDRGRRAATMLLGRTPGGVLLRTIGRQYPGEDLPRWSYGIYAKRNGQPFYDGPPDPMGGGGTAETTDAHLQAFTRGLAAALGGRVVAVDGPLGTRVIARADGASVDDLANGLADDLARSLVNDLADAPSESTSGWGPALRRAPLHTDKLADTGPVDTLAAEGIHLFCCGLQDGALCLELPVIADAERFVAIVTTIGGVAADSGVPSMVLLGYPPPVDATVVWSTVTPDPGVIEFNLAPHADVAGFAAANAAIFEIADALALTPYRAYFNGDVVDSGGGGQVTFGGPSPERSPFFVVPHLLPRLITYLNRHPSLSYWLGLDAVGGSSQAPRPDEGARESYEELAVALDALLAHPHPSPDILWHSLGPLLTDRFGNGHRAEVNVEKLWNPYLPLRGQLGLVEFRALRMAATQEKAVAAVVLLRSLLGYLAMHSYDLPTIDWGGELHDRFSLPYYLRRDLDAVLRELSAGGFPVGDAIAAELLDDTHLLLASASLGDAVVAVRRAREFWPLLGDLSQEQGTHRLVDPSTTRVELRIEGKNLSALSGLWITCDGHLVPTVDELDDAGAAALIGIRRREFVPQTGLHPLVPAHGPLEIQVGLGEDGDGISIVLHPWSVGDRPYDGLPDSLQEAARRRAERAVQRAVRRPDSLPPQIPGRAVSRFSVDLRRMHTLSCPTG